MNRMLISAAAMGLCALACAAGPIELQPGVRLKAGDQVIDDKNGGHFVPTVADWNGDGKKDLIIGMFAGDPGNVRLYLNVGTDAEPKFDKFTCMEADGKPILLSAG
jgi:hypothetical protein